MDVLKLKVFFFILYLYLYLLGASTFMVPNAQSVHYGHFHLKVSTVNWGSEGHHDQYWTGI